MNKYKITYNYGEGSWTETIHAYKFRYAGNFIEFVSIDDVVIRIYSLCTLSTIEKIS